MAPSRGPEAGSSAWPSLSAFAAFGLSLLLRARCDDEGVSQAAGAGTLLPLRDEPYAATWEVIARKQACEANGEGLKPHAVLGGISSTLQCMRLCERRWGCLAVDYYEATRYCNIYRQVCRQPQALHDGASSYRIRVPIAWDVVQPTWSCGSSPAVWQGAVSNGREGCEDSCSRFYDCLAIDYVHLPKGDWCVLKGQACKNESKSTDMQVEAALSSGSLTSLVMRRSVSWTLNHRSKGCESNEDHIKPIDKRHLNADEAGLDGCKQWCTRDYRCHAIDYYNQTGWCVIYDAACLTPLSTADGVSSWWMLREGVEDSMVAEEESDDEASGSVSVSPGTTTELPPYWFPIDETAACQGAASDIKAFREMAGGEHFSLQSCRQLCERSAMCTAVDWYRKTHYCLLYAEACEKAVSAHDGASSYRIVRADLFRLSPLAQEPDGGARAVEELRWRRRATKALRLADVERRGLMRLADFQRALPSSTGNGNGISEEDMAAIVSEVAVDAEGRVNYEDILPVAQSVLWR
eukprot:TRINITY_DN80011_c0_g1_i1.p1 TRINITY_DN80011_c0_g1~~TRINITY_DN80011_c0_g1_i1.p1  ORF type:complete len:542 (+),score=115.39 TRINITY_DN80011_c0_g1_i1:61-1626(+)